jgi:hypothetical protein
MLLVVTIICEPVKDIVDCVVLGNSCKRGKFTGYGVIDICRIAWTMTRSHASRVLTSIRPGSSGAKDRLQSISGARFDEVK